MKNHYAIIGMAHVAEDYPLYYDAMNEKGVAISGESEEESVSQFFHILGSVD